jgi:hypothetical protein
MLTSVPIPPSGLPPPHPWKLMFYNYSSSNHSGFGDLVFPRLVLCPLPMHAHTCYSLLALTHTQSSRDQMCGRVGTSHSTQSKKCSKAHLHYPTRFLPLNTPPSNSLTNQLFHSVFLQNNPWSQIHLTIQTSFFIWSVSISSYEKRNSIYFHTVTSAIFLRDNIPHRSLALKHLISGYL